MSKLAPRPDHVPLHRIWVFTTLQADLTMAEHAHIIDCEECRIAFRACLRAENFGAVLLELNREDDRPAGPQSSESPNAS
jgi:hypothetical protein